MPNWEVGSEFDWSERFVRASDTKWFPDSYQLFSTGTACIKAIASSRLANTNLKRPKIHLPSFYCTTVARALATDFDIGWYSDVPTESEPNLQSIRAEPGDYILILNTFGLRRLSHWTRWTEQHSAVITIEDHSHDPCSEWAQTSSADYAFASLRKTLPLPDGGILYSPKGHLVPKPTRLSPHETAGKRLTAMLLKNAFLSGSEIDKDVYRQLEIASNENLESELDVAASLFTRNILEVLDISGMRRQKRENIDHFLARASNEPSSHWSPLSVNSLAPEGVPLNMIVTCPHRQLRDSLRRYLIERKIFTAIHWLLDDKIASHDPLAKHLADRVLTVPIDFRYGIKDVDRVFETMLAFDDSND